MFVGTLVGGLAQLGRDQHNRVVGKKGPQGWWDEYIHGKKIWKTHIFWYDTSDTCFFVWSRSSWYLGLTTLLLVKYQKFLVFADVTHHSCIYILKTPYADMGGILWTEGWPLLHVVIFPPRKITSWWLGFYSKKSTFSQGPRFDCWWFLWRSSWSHSCHLHLWCLGLDNFVALLVLGTRGNSILFEKILGILAILDKLLYFEWSPPWHVGWRLSGEGCHWEYDGKNGEFENIDFRFPWLSDTSEMGFGHDVPFLNYSDRLPHPSDLCQPDWVRWG